MRRCPVTNDTINASYSDTPRRRRNEGLEERYLSPLPLNSNSETPVNNSVITSGRFAELNVAHSRRNGQAFPNIWYHAPGYQVP
jgi:type IV secretory pathway VirB4 component